jgi:hypothetical protein
VADIREPDELRDDEDLDVLYAEDEQLTVAQALNRSGRGMHELAIELRATRPQVKGIDRRQRIQSWVLALVAVAVVVSSVGTWTNHALSNAIHDCIDPSGQCYQEGRQRGTDIQRAVLQGQAETAARNLTVVCDLFVAHGFVRPPECTGPPPTSSPPTTAPR